jgi:hypothetical protein
MSAEEDASGTAPDRLVDFGTSIALPGRTVTLTATAGPSLPLAWGTLTIADPWWPEYHDGQIELLGRGSTLRSSPPSSWRTSTSTATLPWGRSFDINDLQAVAVLVDLRLVDDK